MKPGRMNNLSNPETSVAQGIMNAQQIARGSNQTPATSQLSSNPNRLIPPTPSSGPSGTAEVETSGVMEGQGYADTTRSTRIEYGKRKGIFGGPTR